MNAAVGGFAFTPLTVGSLFSGIGAMDLGLERAGMEVKWQCEIDDYASRVLEKHWPHVKRYRDIRTLDAANLVPVDVLAGGFPCTDISSAGKREGIDGKHSGLWSEFARIIGELRPRYILVENVSNLLGRGFERVLGDLAAHGYDAEWDVLSAAEFGAPQIRQRLFLIAYRRQRGAPARSAERNLLADSRRLLMDGIQYQPWSAQASDVAPSSASLAGTVAVSGRSDQHGMGNGSANRVDRIRGLGNAVVPQVAEYIGRCIIEVDRLERIDPASLAFRCDCLTQDEVERLKTILESASPMPKEIPQIHLEGDLDRLLGAEKRRKQA